MIYSKAGLSITETEGFIENPKNCDETLRVIYSTPELNFNLFSLHLNPKVIEDFSNGKGRVAMAACIVFKSLNEKDIRTWTAVIQHVFTAQDFSDLDDFR